MLVLVLMVVVGRGAKVALAALAARRVVRSLAVLLLASQPECF